MDLKNKRKYPYVLNVLIGLDQFVNSIFGGDCDETISSRLGRRKVRMGGKIPFWKHPLSASIDWFLEKIDKGHSVEAIGQ